MDPRSPRPAAEPGVITAAGTTPARPDHDRSELLYSTIKGTPAACRAGASPAADGVSGHAGQTGKLSYRGADGRPLVAPVWFVIDDGQLVFNTGKDTAKGRALARDPRATICVDLEQLPYGFVQVQGMAELSEDPADLLATATAIAARYIGPERAQEFGRRNGVPGELVVRLRPVKVIASFNMIS